MKLDLIEDGDRLAYRAHAVTPREQMVLRAALFAEDEGVWLKAFDRRALLFEHDLELLRHNFERLVRREAAGPPTAEVVFGALERVHDAFSGAGMDWWLAGSGALLARGLDVRPHDLDVMIDESHVERLVGIARPLAVEPFHRVTGWVVRGFGVLDMGCRVDVGFEPEAWVDEHGPVDFGPAAARALETITWRGLAIRVAPLAYHLGPNRARGRHAVVEAIERRLAAR